MRGLGQENKRRKIFNFYRKRSKILVLQETHSTQTSEEIWRNEWGGRIIFSHGESNTRGVAILFQKGFNCNITNITTDNSGRFIACDIENDTETINLCNVYGPNNDSPGFYAAMMEQIVKSSQTSKRIIIGDFNTVLDAKLDRTVGSNQNLNSKSSHQLRQLCEEHYLQDVWRARNGETKRYSWFRLRPYIVGSRLDFALVSLGLTNYVKEIMYFAGIQTDHSALYLYLETNENTRGVGYWKFNTKYLQDELFLQSTRSFIQEQAFEKKNLQAMDKWEAMKRAIIKHCQEYAINSVNDRALIISQLTEKVIEMEDNLTEKQSENWCRILENTKIELTELTDQHTKSIMFRSKAQWMLEGERNTSYFYGLEKARYNARTCMALITDSGKHITDPEEILEEQRLYYEELYTADPNINFDLVNEEDIKVTAHKSISESQLELAEFSKALLQLNNNKTPGPDGLPPEFYKIFWAELKQIIYEAFLQSFEMGVLYKSAREGIINIIPKANKDTRYLKNLRPITLLNADYKILEKVLANRIEAGLDDIIHSDQKGFLPNRAISTNIRRIFDAMKYCKEEEIDGIILSLDFSKCFDRISHITIKKALDYFGFSTVTQKWISVMYDNFAVKVQNNGNFSKKLKVCRGIHQGGNASIGIFLICAELLAIKFRGNEKIKGIPVADFLLLLGQYADDMDNFLQFDQNSFKEVERVFSHFQQVSGFSINYDKTSIYRIGSLKDSNATLVTQKPFKWTNSGINVLGIDIHSDTDVVLERNYAPLMDKCKQILDTWKRRRLSLEGKVQVANSLIGSQFVYKMQVLPRIPDKYVSIINKMITDFIWDGKKPKIKLKQLQSSRDSGGLKLVDLEKKDISLKIGYIKEIGKDKIGEELAYRNLEPEMRDTIWRCNQTRCNQNQTQILY